MIHASCSPLRWYSIRDRPMSPPARVNSELRDRSDGFFRLYILFFPFMNTFFYIFVYLKFNFLYILLYIEIPCTMLILQKRYAHGTFAAGRAYMPTQEKKT